MQTKLIQALIFPLSSVFKYRVDYSGAVAAVGARFSLKIDRGAGPPEIIAAVSTVPDRSMAAEGLSWTNSVLDRTELVQASSAAPHPGALVGLKAASSKSIKLGLISDLGTSATNLVISKLPNAPKFDALICRDVPRGPHSLSGDLLGALRILKVEPRDGYLFCSSLPEISAAREVGLEAVVLPLGNHDVNALIAAGPSKMLMSLGELEDMLALSS